MRVILIHCVTDFSCSARPLLYTLSRSESDVVTRSMVEVLKQFADELGWGTGMVFDACAISFVSNFEWLPLRANVSIFAVH